ncbi:hypothetical protein ACFIQF_02860 [Comamonas sp. J-3]|uniref:hypothetical protein n=1 Tax=Comamonas trifloxystrobinivorans TaxID=3350256 RepID=UPI00372B8A9C
MYTEVFAFRFAPHLHTSERLRIFADIVAAGEAAGQAQSVYWCSLSRNGHAQMYSATPSATTAIEQALRLPLSLGRIRLAPPSKWLGALAMLDVFVPSFFPEENSAHRSPSLHRPFSA